MKPTTALQLKELARHARARATLLRSQVPDLAGYANTIDVLCDAMDLLLIEIELTAIANVARRAADRKRPDIAKGLKL